MPEIGNGFRSRAYLTMGAETDIRFVLVKCYGKKM